MNAKVEMKVVRDWLRRQRKIIDNDPYLQDVRGKLTFRIVKWDARWHHCVVMIRNENLPQTHWNSYSTRWVGFSTRDASWKWELWRELNNLCHYVRAFNN
jgi:hypothetical protein